MSAVTNNGVGTTPDVDANGKKKVHDIKDLDVDQFLQLMISELTNQDPLNPMDNSQLVQQIGQLRSITATDQLSGTLASVLTGQSLTTASGLIGKEVSAISDTGDAVSGVVDRVSIDVDKDNSDKRTYRVHVGDKDVDLKNIREVKQQ